MSREIDAFDILAAGGMLRRDAAGVVESAGAAVLASIEAAGDAKIAEIAAAAGAEEYADTAAGLTGTSVGDLFTALDGSGVLTLYRHDAGPTATSLWVYSSASDIAAWGALVDSYRLTAARELETNRLTESTDNNVHITYISMVWANGVNYVLDVVARKDTRSMLKLYCNAGAVFDCTFNLESVTAFGTGASIYPIGNDWCLCRVSKQGSAVTAGNVQLRICDDNGNASYAGDGASGVLVDDVYLYTDSSDTSLLASRDINAADWTKLYATAPKATVDNTGDANLLQQLSNAILGTMTGDKFVEGDGSITPVSPIIYRALTPTNGLAYTVEYEFKAGERKRVNLFNNSGLVYDVTFDLELGTVVGAGGSIAHLGEGWYRASVSVVASSGASGNNQIRVYPDVGSPPYAGDGASGLYCNSASIRQGSGPNLWANSDKFAGTGWTKASLTVDPDVALFRTLSIDSAVPSSKRWAGKKWAAIGTSITAQGYYTTPLALALDAVCQNLGVSGGSIGANSHYGSLALYNAIASIDVDTALVTVESPINDFGSGNTPLGVLGDTSTATLYGALWAAIVAIRARAPNAEIAFLTAYSGGPGTSTHRIGVMNTNGNTLQQFQQAVMEVAEYAGILCVDVGRQSGIGYFTANKFMSDDLHINSAGGDQYTSYVAPKLEEMP